MAAADLIPIIAPSLADNDNLSGAISMAEDMVAADHPYYDQVTAYLAAHILTLAANSSNAMGPVSSKSENNVSISYAVSSDADYLDLTIYGKEVRRLNRLAYGLSARTAWPRT